MDETIFWYWLNNITGIGRKTIHTLLEHFYEPINLFFAKEEEVCKWLQNDKQRQMFAKSKDEKQILASYQKLLEQNISFIHPESENFPEKLRQIPDMPYGLYLKGKLPEANQKTIAIIGSRSCSNYGTSMAKFFGRELAKCGVGVISGLARGIDGMSHTGALEGNGYTLGVLGGGIDKVYPMENYKLFIKMQEQGGILSESNIGIAPAAGLFPQRNRLISGLSDGILVIEAMEKSGTFITVDQGLEQGKDIFAVPGRIMDIKSIGCNNLIKLGAHMVTEVSDILDILHISDKNTRKLNNKKEEIKQIEKMSLAPLEKMVYSCLRIEPKHLDDIILELRIAPDQICRALNQLVLTGVIEEPIRNYYAIKL